MRSSSGKHYLALDHLRALAALLVVSWHFLHGKDGHPVPFEGVPAVFPLAIFDEGHTGVSLFMTLSGYLFAKLLQGKAIHYPSFLWNRALRLLPLLALVSMVYVVQRIIAGADPMRALLVVAAGALLPTLPNGGWSITVEVHFYLLLPFLLALFRKHRWGILAVPLAAILLRTGLFLAQGEVQSLAYATIIGRIDQFVLGIAAYGFSDRMRGKHFVSAAVLLALLAAYGVFDLWGGFYGMPTYPSPSSLWIILPTVEAFSYALLISYYDATYSPEPTGLSWLAGQAGAYSYSVYLLHFYVVQEAANFVDQHLVSLTNFYLALLFAFIFFVLFIPVGYLSFRFIESPFLSLRVHYIRKADVAPSS